MKTVRSIYLWIKNNFGDTLLILIGILTFVMLLMALFYIIDNLDNFPHISIYVFKR
jgi:hypothetical protein